MVPPTAPTESAPAPETYSLQHETYPLAGPEAETYPLAPEGKKRQPHTYDLAPDNAPVAGEEPTLPRVGVETYALAKEPEPPVAEAGQEPLLQDAYESLAEAADKAGEEAARLGKSLPTLGDVIDRAIRDLQARIHDQGTGATPEQKTTLANLQGLGQGQVALTSEDRSALEQRGQAAHNAPENQPVQQASQAPLLEDSYKALQEAARTVGGEAARKNEKTPDLGAVIDRAIRDLQEKISKQGGPTGDQAATLRNLQGVRSGQTALDQEDRQGLEASKLAGFSDPMNRLVGQLKKVSDGFKGLGESFGKLAGAGGAAFAPLAAGMGALARAANPALFDTFSKSVQLLGATLGATVIGPVLTLSFKLQELARWVQGLDPALKSQVGAWLGWATALSGGLYALGKVSGLISSVLPLLAALKGALIFTVTNPFGMLVAGLGALAAFHPEAFAGIGQAIQHAFGDVSWGEVLKALTEALRPLPTWLPGFLGQPSVRLPPSSG